VYVSNIRLIQRYDHIDIDTDRRGYSLAKLYPDNTLEFIAEPSVINAQGASLAQQFAKVVPFDVVNFDTGRYKIVPTDKYADLPPYPRSHNQTMEEWRTQWDERSKALRKLKSEAQEYFMGMKLNIATGIVINPKDMTPDVDEDKRKQWTAGLKAVRLRLRAMERVGVFEQYTSHIPSYTNLTRDDMHRFAEIIMTGEAPQELVEIIARNTSKWKANKVGVSKAMMTTFENLLKSNSRELRLHVGVISIKEE
jgi:hypothetical protein